MPFTLNKPVPTVTHTIAADTGKEAYQVTFNYVADSEMRYTLQIKPSMLASVDFSMTFDAGGSLTEASAKSADQTAALVATVGKLAVLAVADSKAEDADLVEKVQRLGDAFASRRQDGDVWKAIKKSFEELGSAQRIRSEYVYPTSAELTFLRAFLDELKKSAAANGQLGGVTMLPNPGAATFLAQLKQFEEQNATVSDSDFAKSIKEAFSKGDVKQLKDKKAEQVATLETQRAALATNKTEDAKRRVANTLKRISLLTAALKGVALEVAFVADLAEMSLAEWQKRSVRPVAKDIEATQQLLRVAEASQQPADGYRRKLKELMLRKAAILGVLPEYLRRQALTERLATETSAKDLKALREERDALDIAIGAAEPAKQKPKAAVADEPSVAVYMVETPSGLLDNDSIVRRLGEDRPRYVIVVKSLEPAASSVQPKQEAGGTKDSKPVGTPAAAAPNPVGNGDLKAPVAPKPPPLPGQPVTPVEAGKDKQQ